MTSKYQRYLAPGFVPYDPLELSKETEKIVTRGKGRKYVDFYSVPVYRGIATGYAVGCCLRCVYCWSNFSRDFPERYGVFYSPKETFQRLRKAASRGIRYGPVAWRRLPIFKLRVSGCEPTIGKEHLLALLELVEVSDFPIFILETNGILFGVDKDYVRRLSRSSKVHVRVSLKAAIPSQLTKRTGAKPEFVELPFRALKNLMDEDISCHAAAMTDRRVMSERERRYMEEKLDKISPWLAENLEEERIGPYETTKKRLRLAGYDMRI